MAPMVSASIGINEYDCVIIIIIIIIIITINYIGLVQLLTPTLVAGVKRSVCVSICLSAR